MLRRSDFGVFNYFEDLTAGANWNTQITNALDDAMADGFVLLLVSSQVTTAGPRRFAPSTTRAQGGVESFPFSSRIWAIALRRFRVGCRI